LENPGEETGHGLKFKSQTGDAPKNCQFNGENGDKPVDVGVLLFSAIELW
jgi:hypothetical protein